MMAKKKSGDLETTKLNHFESICIIFGEFNNDSLNNKIQCLW